MKSRISFIKKIGQTNLLSISNEQYESTTECMNDVKRSEGRDPCSCDGCLRDKTSDVLIRSIPDDLVNKKALHMELIRDP